MAKMRRPARRRLELLALLGDKCAECGGDDRLQVDHVNGRDWDIRAISAGKRVEKYWDEFLKGVALRALCIHCNSSERDKALDEAYPVAAEEYDPENPPF